MNGHRGLPGGSSAFAQAMSEVTLPPAVEVTNMDLRDNGPSDPDSGPKSSKHQHHEEGVMVQGLHHCYKVEGGHCLTSFRCNHDHAKASHGHIEEINKTAGLSPTPRRRMSIVSSGHHLLTPEEEMFRPRANSDAFRGRRGSITSKASGNNSPGKNSPIVSPAPKRRGSNVVLHSDELHYVYDQYLANKKH